jgi:hypothetical protein
MSKGGYSFIHIQPKATMTVAPVAQVERTGVLASQRTMADKRPTGRNANQRAMDICQKSNEILSQLARSAFHVLAET